MEFENKSTSKNRRLVYFLVLTSVALPVLVGVLVWHFTTKSCATSENNVKPTMDANTGNGVTTALPHSNTTVPPVTEPWRNLRLPNYIIPVHYDITLYPDFYGDSGWFYGNESVELRITQDTQFILIHKNYMNITKTILRYNNTRQEIPIKGSFFYEENQFWVIETRNPIKSPETVILDLQFNGSLTRAIVGFYKSSYINSITNQRRYLASSKFQPVDARRAFPCFDEPNFKAEYTVHLVHRSEYSALSNMPDQGTHTWSVDPSLVVTNFQRSVKMSTYLVCFIVCDFTYLESTTKFGTKVRTYATPDRVNQTRYSLQIAVHTMELFQELFNVPYPLPKQDMIAIPDFVSGAMEHWGLITYRETNMLYDPNEASPANKQRVAVVVAHEISHQWFGNIVTMDWWDDLWLNEGFASLIEYVGTNSAESQWNMMDQFVTEDVQPVMIIDSALSSHPIIVDVNHPDQINEVFDTISYSKGASVIRMLESIMGKDKFYEGIGNFLNAFKWGNAKTDDLWQELNVVNEANFNVKAMMDTWTRQMGLPYISVSYETQNGQPKATAIQGRFIADKETEYDSNESPFQYRWYIYVDYLTNSGTTGNFWINQTQDTATTSIPENPQTDNNAWVKFNINQTGFYRVNYPIDVWQKFANTLKGNAEALSEVDKAGLIDDAFNLARGGYIEYESPMELTLYLNKETSHLPWESAYNNLRYLTTMLETVGTFSTWRRYILSKCKPVMENLAWEDTGSHLTKLMRVNLIALTCGMGNEECLQNATTIFRNWVDNGVSIPPNTRSLVYKYGMQNSGSSDDWDKMWQKYKIETVPQERIKLLYGMANTKHVWLLVRFLEFCKDETMVRSQDFFTVLQYIAQNTVGKPIVWDWIRTNWEYLVERFTTYSRSLGRLVPAVISNFNTEFHLREVQAFFEKYPDAGAGARGRIQAVESIKRNVAWMARNERPILEWLCKHVPVC